MKEARRLLPGRPKGIRGKSQLDPFKAEIEEMLDKGWTTASIAKHYDFSKPGLVYWLRREGLVEGV